MQQSPDAVGDGARSEQDRYLAYGARDLVAFGELANGSAETGSNHNADQHRGPFCRRTRPGKPWQHWQQRADQEADKRQQRGLDSYRQLVRIHTELFACMHRECSLG